MIQHLSYLFSALVRVSYSALFSHNFNNFSSKNTAASQHCFRSCKIFIVNLFSAFPTRFKVKFCSKLAYYCSYNSQHSRSFVFCFSVEPLINRKSMFYIDSSYFWNRKTEERVSFIISNGRRTIIIKQPGFIQSIVLTAYFNCRKFNFVDKFGYIHSIKLTKLLSLLACF